MKHVKPFECAGFTAKHYVNFKYSSSRELVDGLIAQVFPVAASAFGRDDHALYNDVRNHVASAEHLAVVLNGAKCIAFRTWEFVMVDMRCDALYLSGMCVRREY